MTFGRVIYTGLYTHGSAVTAQHTMQSHFNSQNDLPAELYESRVTSGTGYSSSYYTNDNFPKTGLELLTINYYDSYDDVLPSGLTSTVTTTYSLTSSTDTKGLSTISKVKVLDTSDWITTVSYYDDKARPIYSYSKNDYLNTTDIIESDLDFVGKLMATTTSHTNSDTSQSTIEIEDVFTYDHAGRLEKQTQQIGTGNLEVIVDNTYDELGQLESKGVGGTTSQSRLQTVDYTYNVRGWLKQINDPSSLGTDLFSFKINYNTVDHSGTALYNGNISETEWKTSNDNTLRWYTYEYDALNRISSTLDYTTYDDYSLNRVRYDKNGNILNLDRRGHTNPGASTFGLMDDLDYVYDGNQLTKVTDAVTGTAAEGGFDDGNKSGDDYAYDVNGNMTKDLNKGIETNGISYNHLNLPTEIDFGGGDKIEYIYDASGIKLEKVVTEGSSVTKTKYAGNFIYEKVPSLALVLKFFSHPEGFTEYDGSGYDYVYQYKDHLGNIRLNYKNVGTGGSISLQIQEENNYYPFGLKHKGYNGNIVGTDHKYGFGGKEEQDELGLEWIDVTARNYDAALGRWMNIDPLAEQMRRHSPYNYAFNNPIFFMDPDGMAPLGSNDDDDPGDKYKTRQAAAEDFALQYNGLSIKTNIEFGAKIYQGKDKDGGAFYSYTIPEASLYTENEDGTGELLGGFGIPMLTEEIPEGTEQVAEAHTHGHDDKARGELDDVNEFSAQDKNANRLNAKMIKGYSGFVSTPNGALLEHDPYVKGETMPADGKVIRTISTKIPSDPASAKNKTRLNSVSPNVVPNVLPKVYVSGALRTDVLKIKKN